MTDKLFEEVTKIKIAISRKEEQLKRAENGLNYWQDMAKKGSSPSISIRSNGSSHSGYTISGDEALKTMKSNISSIKKDIYKLKEEYSKL